MLATVATKCCSKCNQFKPACDFYGRKRATDGLQAYCKICCDSKTAEWRANNKQKSNAYSLKYGKSEKGKALARKRGRPADVTYAKKLKKFGIALDNYNEMLEAQNGVCAICGCNETRHNGRSGKLTKLALDHDHDTGQIRMLLCSACNTALGLFQDNPELLEAAAAYLRQFQQTPVFENSLTE